MFYHRNYLTPAASLLIALVTLIRATADEPPEVTEAKKKKWNPISLSAFRDGINHAVMGYKGNKAPYPQYTTDQIIHISENILAWQNADGGWPKNKDWTQTMSAKKLAELRKRRYKGRSSLDNRNTWSHINYLTHVHKQTGLKRYADAAIKGIRYILKNQHKSGGWRGADVNAITFNDSVMTGVLHILHAILTDRKLFSFVPEKIRKKVEKAYDDGMECLFKCQIRVNGRLTAWCQQHSHKTYKPVKARSYEPASIVTAESVYIVRFLMSLEKPSPRIREAIHAAVAWLDKVKIHGIRIKKVKAKPVKFSHHWCDFDTVEVKDPDAPPIWARFYDLKKEKPIFANRNGKTTRNYMDVTRERRTGYSWYGYYPAKLLKEEYPSWVKKHGEKSKV